MQLSNIYPKLTQGAVLSTSKHFRWYKPQTWLPKVIRSVTGGMVGHSAIVFESGGGIYIAEAVFAGVRIVRNMEKWFAQDMEVYVSYPDTRLPNNFVWRILSRVGNTKYDFWVLFIQLWYKLTGTWLPKQEGERGDQFVCVEFVAYALDKSEPWKYTPQSLIEEIGNWEKIK